MVARVVVEKREVGRNSPRIVYISLAKVSGKGTGRSGSRGRCRTNARAGRGLCRADARAAFVGIQ
jgi:hypothetical protein